MKPLGWIWKMAMVALMGLAVIFVWSPVGSDIASPNVQAAGSASGIHHSLAEENEHQRVLHVTLDADCKTSAAGCCMMTHCHPGISVDPHEVIDIVASDETTTAVASRGSGHAPGVIPPPPRRSSL